MPEELLSTDPNAATMLSDDPNAAMIMETQPKTDSAKASMGPAVSTALVAHLLPYVQRGIEEFATNPNVKPGAAAIGRVVGGVTSFPAGIAGFGDVAKGAWTGGKAGWFTGKLAQDIALHVSALAEKIQPLLSAMTPAIGAEGITELAQLAEPDRSDIGTMGVGKSVTNEQLIERLRKQLANPKIDKDPQRRAGLVAAINQLKGK